MSMSFYDPTKSDEGIKNAFEQFTPLCSEGNIKWSNSVGTATFYDWMFYYFIYILK